MSQGPGGRAGTATVLFTDLVGSTALRQALGDDRADDVRRAHDRMLREALAAHGGTEVKGMGDGLMVVFGASAEAVAAAVDMQRAVARFNRRAPAPLGLRVGVSAGDVVWEDGDCFGTPVVEARRLCDAAEGGQILTSDVVRILAGSRGGHRFASIGALELKGLAEPLTTAEVGWEPQAGGPVPLPAPFSAAESVPFVGREEERARLATAWKEAQRGSGRTVLISGEPGVGKTRLAAEIARIAHDEGATVLLGRCDEDLGIAYQPFVEAFDAYVRACSTEDLAEQAGRTAGDLARLLPRLAERVPDLPDALRAEPETERYRLFEAVRSFTAAVAGATPLVLVLDDIHWAAKPTLLLMRHLARSQEDVRLLILGTYRDTELSRSHPLAQVLADLRREEGVERVALRGLSEDEVTAFVEAAAGQPLDDETGALARAVYAETEGNPFFMGQVLRHLVESGAVVQQDGRWVRGAAAADIGIPEGVREVVGRRLSRLSDDANVVLTTAAVIGREFDTDLLVATSSAEEDAVYDALEVAEQARLIVCVDGRPGRYTFAHALVRSTLYDEISTTGRLRLHKKVGRTIEARTGGVRVEELAHHYCECAALGEVAKAVEFGRAAARRALDRLAYEEAAGWYERALAVLDPESTADRETRAELLLGLGGARWAAGDRPIAKSVLGEAGALAKAAGRAELLADIAIVHGGKRGWGEAGIVDEQLVSLLEDALAALPPADSRHRAMAQARLAAELYFEPGNDERRKTLTEQAVAMARRIDDPDALAYTLTCAHWGCWVPGNVNERAPMAAEIVRLAQASGNRELESAGWTWQATDAFEQGDVDAGRYATHEARRLAEELRQPESLWASSVLLGCIALLEGRLDDAERISEEALQIGERAGTSTAMQMYGVQVFALRRMRGGMEELEPVIKAMVDEYPRIPAWRCGLAYLYSELGWLDAAREQFEILAASDFDLPFDANWSIGMAILAFAASKLGDKERAGLLYDRLLPYAEMTVFAGMPADVIGPAHMPLSLLAATLGRWDESERHSRLAMERNAAMGARPSLARSQYEFAEVLRRRGDARDSEEARQLLESCIATCRELGISLLLERAEGLLSSI